MEELDANLVLSLLTSTTAHFQQFILSYDDTMYKSFTVERSFHFCSTNNTTRQLGVCCWYGFGITALYVGDKQDNKRTKISTLLGYTYI